jgi:hypothetical protein
VKPSDVLLLPIPLVDTFGKAEVEIAAAMLVRACHDHGDAWQKLTWAQVQATLRRDIEAKRPPFVHLVGNPFMRPDFHELARLGLTVAEGEGDAKTFEFTPEALARIRA